MRIRVLLPLTCIVGIATSSAAHAAPPPPPPPTPNCTICNGPPPPPAHGTPVPPTKSTPVPTVAPIAVAPHQVVAVHLTPSRVKRGQDTKLGLSAASHSLVTVSVQYLHSRAVTLRVKLGDSGTLTKYWKVPDAAPPGKAVMTVKVTGSETYSTTLTFTVI